MKIKTLTMASIMLGTIALASCSQNLYRYDESNARFEEPTMKTYVSPTIADLNVQSTRVSHTEVFDNSLDLKDLNAPDRSGTITYMKAYTVSMAARKSNADVIIGPIFDMRTSDDFQKVTVSVVGYPATYVNFRKATDDDFKLIRQSTATNTVLVTDEEFNLIDMIDEFNDKIKTPRKNEK